MNLSGLSSIGRLKAFFPKARIIKRLFTSLLTHIAAKIGALEGPLLAGWSCPDLYGRWCVRVLNGNKQPKADIMSTCSFCIDFCPTVHIECKRQLFFPTAT